MSILWLLPLLLLLIALAVFIITDKRAGAMTNEGPVTMFYAAQRPYKSLNSARLFGQTTIYVEINNEFHRLCEIQFTKSKMPAKGKKSGSPSQK